MQDLRKIIADNISELRTGRKMTQAELADVFNYTDKAVSKWERGEALPDITVLAEIAEYFGVTVDYLLHKEHSASESAARDFAAAISFNHFIITMMSFASVWVLAAVGFLILMLSDGVAPPWLSFIYAVPVCSVVLLVLNSIWGKRKLNFLIVSLLLWSVFLSVYLSFLTLGGINLWMLFIVCVPAQAVILFVPGLKPSKKRKKTCGKI